MTLLRGSGLQGVLDQGDEALRNLLSIDDEPPLEEPVPRVLAVGLGDVEALDVRRVATDPVEKEGRVVVEIPVVEGQPHLPVDPFQGRPALLDEGDFEGRLRFDPGLEAGEGFRVGTFRHAVVHFGQEFRFLVTRKRNGGPDQVAPRAFDPSDSLQSTGVTNGNRVRGPGGREVHSRTDFQEFTVTVQETSPPEPGRLESLTEEPGEDPEFVGSEVADGVDVEAVLGVDLLDAGIDALPRCDEESISPSGREARRAVEVEQTHGIILTRLRSDCPDPSDPRSGEIDSVENSP